MREFIFTDEQRDGRKPAFAKATTAAFAIEWPASRSSEGAKAGGARRNRTDDLLLAKQALSQLSYGPFRDQLSGIRHQDVFLIPAS